MTRPRPLTALLLSTALTAVLAGCGASTPTSTPGTGNASTPVSAPVSTPSAPTASLLPTLDKTSITVTEGGSASVTIQNPAGGHYNYDNGNIVSGVTESYQGSTITFTGAASMYPSSDTVYFKVTTSAGTVILPLKVTVLGTRALPASYPSRGASSSEQGMLAMINALRAKGATCGSTTYAPTGPLVWNGALFSAALQHSSDMMTLRYFAHPGLDGSTPMDRAYLAGFRPNYGVGENIAAFDGSDGTVNDADAALAFSLWVESAGHCANMMNPAFTTFAVADSIAADQVYTSFWTMELGRDVPNN